jgi:hypothetical protein
VNCYDLIKNKFISVFGPVLPRIERKQPAGTGAQSGKSYTIHERPHERPHGDHTRGRMDGRRPSIGPLVWPSMWPLCFQDTALK